MIQAEELTDKEELFKKSIISGFRNFLLEVFYIMQTSELCLYQEQYINRGKLTLLEMMEIWTEEQYPSDYEAIRFDDLNKIMKVLSRNLHNITADIDKFSL